MSTRQNQPYIVVSGDSHVGPSLERHLRPYCPERHLEAFDEFAATSKRGGVLEGRITDFATPIAREAAERSRLCPGLQDPSAFLQDMDTDGIAAQVIFAGGGNGEPTPWVGGLIRAATDDYPDELIGVGVRIWNEWLSDFTSVDRARLLGVAQLPMHDLDAAIKEVRWAAAHGLAALNLPAPRIGLPPYNDSVWEPFWSAVEETGLAFVTHGASGDVPQVPASNIGAYFVWGSEILWLSRRGLPQLIFGGVFERHPTLRVAFTEQRVVWAIETVRELDSIYLDPNRSDPSAPPRKPSEYWAQNCYLVGSFMAPFEAARRAEVGVGNLMWGTDYPHIEGTWPRTRLSLRNTFSGIPHDDVRRILGENAIKVYGLDAAALREIADRIGPTPEEIDHPLGVDERPEHLGFAFREIGAFA